MEGEAPPHFAQHLSSYLNALPPTALERLYESSSSCLAIFRLLPESARTLVLNMLWMDGTLAGEDLLGIMARRSEGRRRLETAVAALVELNVLAVDPEGEPLRQQALKLDTTFRTYLRRALTGGDTNASFGVQDTSLDDEGMSIADLDELSRFKWESLLHYMVGSRNVGADPPSASVLRLLQRAELMTTGERGGQLKITSRGFQFLLEDIHTQLWELLLRYLSMMEERGVDIVEILSFLFMLGSLKLGKVCYQRGVQRHLTSGLSAIQLECLSDMRELGLVHQSGNAKSSFYPTRLATTLTSGVAASAATLRGGEPAGFLILETNYRVYAYTSNSLQLAILNLFVSLRNRFPNLAIGTITRESVKAALANGINADQIISYLGTHAHSQMRKQAAVKEAPLLPVTVLDQIRIWENDKNRVRSAEGYLYEDFKSDADFEMVRNYAREIDAILWEGEPKMRKVFVTAEGHAAVRTFITRRMTAAS